MPFGFSRKDDAQGGPLPAGFRPDIEGLRAVAVLSVVLFHLKVSAFSGGFSGVDIFFVISGYLITRNILTDREARRFTFRNFYARRIRRIFPAMLVTVAATLVAGTLWFPPSMFIDLARSSFASLAFVSNVYFWWGAQQYFSPDSNLLALLHLWSLSVEEQFYIFWPLVIVAVSTARSPKLLLCMGAIAAVSFAAADLVAKFDGSGVFYLMPFRVYQFALGAFVLCIERWISAGIGIQRMAQALGLALCTIGIFGLNSHLRFHGVPASVGAALIIYGGSERASMPILTNAVAAYIGRISYSLYLVHWPVAVFAGYIFGEKSFGLSGLAVQIVIILVLAALMYRFVERPFLSAHNARPKAFDVRLLITASVALAAVSIAIVAGGGWNWRLSPAQQRVNTLEAFGVAPCAREKTSCVFGAKNGTRSAMLMGDSYAQHYVSAIDKIAGGLGVRVEEQIQQGCLVLSGLMRLGYPDDRCRTGRDRVLAAVKQSAAPVIISEAWMGYTDGNLGDDKGHPIDVKSETKRLDVLRQALERTIAEIARPNRRILIIGAQVLAACDFKPAHLGVGPLPHERNAPCGPRSRTDAHRATAGVNNMLAGVQAKHPGIVSLVFPEDYMCEATCPIIRDDGVWLYQDGGHLTVAGSLRFGEGANAAITSFFEGGKQTRAVDHQRLDAQGRSH